MRRYLAALAGILTLAPLRDAPPSHRYQVDYWNTQVFDYSGQGQPIQRIGFGYSTWLEVAYADSTPALRRFTMVVDSARLTQGSIVPLPVDSLAGASWRGVLTDSGTVEGWLPSKDRPGAGHLRTQLWHFHPRVPATVALGTEWTDSVSQLFHEVNGAVTFTLLTRYVATAIDTVNGVPAWRIDAALTWRQDAALQFTSRTIGSLNGEGKGTGRYHVSVEDRTYLDGEFAWSADLILAVPGRREVPVHDSTYSRVMLRP